ncbi:MAG: hypothetical protein P4L95_12960 [Rouxiella aceris]|nr:hypothetical protein [Rouxiella aceris]MDR3432792.1 hypothetical protein [Rouxiella aceris]
MGDKTPCSGELLSGDTTFICYGVPTALGGVQDICDEGQMLAG